MPKRKLAIFLAGTLGIVAMSSVALSAMLAVAHKPFVIPLLSVTACLPGFVVAGLAWRGLLPSRCAAEPER
jgi:hypothetical protein